MDVSWGHVEAAATAHVGRVGKRGIWDMVGAPEIQVGVGDARRHEQPHLRWLVTWPDSL